MNNFKLLQNCLKIAAGITVVGGLLIALTASTQSFGFFDTNIDPVFLKGAASPEFFLNFKGWIYGVLGSTMLMLGIITFFIVTYGFETRQKWTWNALVAALSVWFVVDSAISAAFGVNFNVIFNTVFLLMYMIPLILIKKHIKEPVRV